MGTSKIISSIPPLKESSTKFSSQNFSEGMGEFELVRRMRIDFNVIPIKGNVCYSVLLNREILLSIRKLVGEEYGVDKADFYVTICRGKSLFGLRLRKFSGSKYDEQLRDGDPGYAVIRGAALGFVDRYPGDDWDQQFDNARFSLIHDLNCKFYDNGTQLLITHLHPSEDAHLFFNLISRDTQSPPTLVLDFLPPYWLQLPSLQNLLHSLAKIRDLDVCWNKVCIQFKNYKQCYKALKKLCSHSLKIGDGRVVDYELILKDISLESNAFDEVLAYKNNYYNQSATTQALNNRVTMFEKEFSTVKGIMEKSKISKGSSKARALFYRAIMLEKRLDIVKSVMEEIGAESHSTQALGHRVLVLSKELSTIKVVLEDVSTNRVRALEMRVEALENELKSMKESADVHNELPTDQALKRCKRLRRG